MTDPVLNKYIDSIEDHLKSAAAIAQNMKDVVQQMEGDSDLYRKLSFYLCPNLIHWITGMQAGNMKDLKETVARRLAPAGDNAVQSVNGDKVLTKSD